MQNLNSLGYESSAHNSGGMSDTTVSPWYVQDMAEMLQKQLAMLETPYLTRESLEDTAVEHIC